MSSSAKEACPEGSKLGTARASTPLLDEPARGAGLPENGPEPAARPRRLAEGRRRHRSGRDIGSQKGGLRTTFASVPDAPITSFELDLVGGKKGLLQNTESLCGSAQRAIVRMAGQNGISNRDAVRIRACGKGSAASATTLAVIETPTTAGGQVDEAQVTTRPLGRLRRAAQAAAAHGEITYQSSFGSAGSGAGQLSDPASVSINNSTGDVYVADNGNNRIQQFTEDGEFVRAWGYDVVASGRKRQTARRRGRGR